MSSSDHGQPIEEEPDLEEASLISVSEPQTDETLLAYDHDE